ncbi:putative bifunctional diguanylate cyclase/phosphodiesterase [Cellulomonas marina]|uniref:putative bifunctional diguanylate cyclase/phosphodiesterase n=1 Tax=Cellulomonas marina TaxID=988821 RepID=UPI001113913C|nr:EAL domain-containing protein [Cellulomonas marina]GIG28365.1 hypothetical protein Cma02nite_09650 [Cellulomonas marina]
MQGLLELALAAAVLATPVLSLRDYASLRATADSFSLAQDVTGNLADAQRDALLALVQAERLDAGDDSVVTLRQQSAFLGQQVRILAAKDLDGPVAAQVTQAVADHARLDAHLEALPDVLAPDEVAAARATVVADAEAVVADVRGLYARLEGAFYSELSDRLQQQNAQQRLVVVCAALSLLLGGLLVVLLQRSVRREFSAAYALVVREAAERAEAQRAVELSERRFRALVAHGNDITLVLDERGALTYVDPRTSTALGTTVGPLDGLRVGDLVPADLQASAVASFRACLAAPGATTTLDVAVRLPRAGQDPAGLTHLAVRLTNLLGDPAVAGVVVNAHDVTDRTRHAAELEHLAYHDRVTGLPNRLRLDRDLDAAAADDEHGTGVAALAVLDLDGFRSLNERVGALRGDAVLHELGARLRRHVPDGVVYHLGGDEFVVRRAGDDDAHGLAQTLRAALRVPLDAVPGVAVTAGIGVVAARAADVRPHELVRHADAAMQEAKRRGPDQVETVDGAGLAEQAARQHLVDRLAEAIAHDRLELHYQPIVRTGDRSWVAVEALVRWRTADRLVPPDEFIPLAEESGLVLALGRWVVATAVRDLAVMRAAGRPDLRVSVNVAATQLHDLGFLDHVRHCLARARLSPDAVVLELTATVVLEDPEHAIAVLAAAQAVGMEVALDDFGTGYSSLAYLLRLPVDLVKLDRSFLRDLTVSPRTRRLLGALTAIVHDLGMRVTVEGVETEAEMAAVVAAGCDTVQGYLLARPAPLGALTPAAPEGTAGVRTGLAALSPVRRRDLAPGPAPTGATPRVPAPRGPVDEARDRSSRRPPPVA